MLQLFLSRKAQPGPHLSSRRLLRHLALLLLLVLGFLAVWTVWVLERGLLHVPLVTRGHTPTGRHFYLCHHGRWDYIMVGGELLPLSPVPPWPWALPLPPPAVLWSCSSCLVPRPLAQASPQPALQRKGQTGC